MPLQLQAPKLAILRPLIEFWQREEVASVKAGRTLQAFVQLLEVVGCSNHKDSVIILQPVYLVEEVAQFVWCDLRVNVFDEKEARRHHASKAEDLSDTPRIRYRLHIQQSDWLRPLLSVGDE